MHTNKCIFYNIYSSSDNIFTLASFPIKHQNQKKDIFILVNFADALNIIFSVKI